MAYLRRLSRICIRLQADADGNIWVALCLTGSFGSDGLYRGWVVRVTPDGKTIPTCSGIRSPGGIGANAAGDMFYTDNQGPWNGTCALKHLAPSKFMGILVVSNGIRKPRSISVNVLMSPKTVVVLSWRLIVSPNMNPPRFYFLTKTWDNPRLELRVI